MLAKSYETLGRYHESLEQLQLCITLQAKGDPEASRAIERIEATLRAENGQELGTAIDEEGGDDDDEGLEGDDYDDQMLEDYEHT